MSKSKAVSMNLKEEEKAMTSNFKSFTWKALKN